MYNVPRYTLIVIDTIQFPVLLVFVEVKTRKSNLFGEPSEYVDHKKQERVKKAAMVYADVENTDMRFDVIEVFYEEKNGELFLVKVNHIENAF